MHKSAQHTILGTCIATVHVYRFVHMHKNAPLIGSAQAAKAFRVDRATFNRWVKAGRIPVEIEMDGFTGARLFDADLIDALAAEYRASREGGEVA